MRVHWYHGECTWIMGVHYHESALGSWVCTTMRVHLDHALEWVYCMGYLHGSGGAAHTYHLSGALLIFLLAKAIRKNTFRL